MLNGQRQMWDAKTVYSGGKKEYVGTKYHRVCPSYKPLSSITNNGFVGISWFFLAITGGLVTAGVFATMYIGWPLGVLLFIVALLPHAWLINRYFDSTPYKWENSGKLHDAENAFYLMSPARQKEYRSLLDKTFKGHLKFDKAKQLFEQFSELLTIQADLDAEVKRQKELRDIMHSIDPLENM